MTVHRCDFYCYLTKIVAFFLSISFCNFHSALPATAESSILGPQPDSPPSQHLNPPQDEGPVIETTTPLGDGSKQNGSGTTVPPRDGSNFEVDVTTEGNGSTFHQKKTIVYTCEEN